MPYFNSPVYNAVERGYIKVYKLDKGKQFRSSQELSVASHPIWSQHLQSEYAEGSINQLRATLACALSESLDGRWYDRDVENRMLYNQGFGARMKLRVEHTAQAAVTHVSESLQELIDIGIVLFKGVQASYQAYLELRQDIDEKGAAAITERMHALGIKIEQGVDKVTALLKQGLSMLNTILSDPYCRGYLFEYFDGLKESISELGRCRMIGGFIGELGLDFIIAIATGGIGLIPRAAQLIGGLSYKVLKVMLKIYDALQAKAGQALEASRVAQRQLDLELNRSIAPKVPEEHKLKQEKEASTKETLSSQVLDEVNIAHGRREQNGMPKSVKVTTDQNLELSNHPILKSDIVPSLASHHDLRKFINSNGIINYGKKDFIGRPTGVNSILTPNTSEGTSPSSGKTPGFSRAQRHTRGHLLGAQLGGSGSESRNLVTQFPSANANAMSKIEDMVRAEIDLGNVVEYSINPVYRSEIPIPFRAQSSPFGPKPGYHAEDLIPQGITIRAKSSSGKSFKVSVPNTPDWAENQKGKFELDQLWSTN